MMFVNVTSGWIDSNNELQDKQKIYLVKKHIQSIQEQCGGSMITMVSGFCHSVIEEPVDLFSQLTNDKD